MPFLVVPKLNRIINRFHRIYKESFLFTFLDYDLLHLIYQFLDVNQKLFE